MTTDKKLYVQMFSIHGLLRSVNLEMGVDADTGGQIKYVIELASSLSELDTVAGVDLFTRLIDDKIVSRDYARPIEDVNPKFRIVRIQCGGRKYMRKELLWPHIEEFVDRTIKFNRRENIIPDLVHGHYADGGLVAKELSEIFDIPLLFTGHSLGKSKKKKLLKEGMTEGDIIKKYKIDRRIRAEEEVMSAADLIITSTQQEVSKQYDVYRVGKKTRFKVLPPGIDIEKFYPYYHDMIHDVSRQEDQMHARASVIREMDRFFTNTEKPLILALCRPDKRKNISGLIQAYGEDLQLQAMANLAIFAGIRKNITDKEENEREVLTDMLLMMDRYDLYGKMAIPKKHDFELEVPELYRVAAAKKGVFVNPALIEPFGLTLLEAGACGLPIVATNDGGPRDIVKACRNGILVDPTDTRQISRSVREIIADNQKWETFSTNGITNVRRHYTWLAHSQKYVQEVSGILEERNKQSRQKERPVPTVGKRLSRLNTFILTDIDNTLIGKDNAGLPELCKLLQTHRDRIGFGVATGRTLSSALAQLEAYDIPQPDILITAVGSEIYYGAEGLYDRGWDSHLAYKWRRKKIINLLGGVDYLEFQEESAQGKYKVSYNMEPGKDRLQNIHRLLTRNRLRYKMVYSHGRYLDILPYRASKGKAIRYISDKWQIPLDHFLVCGDSGNDEEMLKGEMRSVIVGNYSSELRDLKGSRRVYFSQKCCAAGILDGIHHYDFIALSQSAPPTEQNSPPSTGP